jgi:heme exporter protein A
VKLAYATLHDPGVLLLDEPGANLDEAGRAVVQRVVASQRSRGIAVIASNDVRDLALADERLALS